MKQPHAREQGQAIVILALMMIGLLAFAALAIDGGNAYVERRRAQNGADAAALAGARQVWLQRSNSDSSETPIVRVMNTTASQNGIALSADPADPNQANVTAYYCLDDKCTSLSANQVGATGSIPSNAKGIQVVAARQFNAFIGGIIGQRPVGATAQATAVLILPPSCGDFAIYAAGDPGNMVNNLQITGGGQGIQIIDGGLYSGGDTHINNVSISGGSIYSGGSCGPGGQCSGTGANEVMDSAPPQAYNSWDINDFKPGNSVATTLGSAYHYVNGDLNSITQDGVYYVTGDVQIGGGTGSHRVTIVSEGTQKYTGKVDLLAYWNNLLFFSNSDNQNHGAIQISASDSIWQGLIYAPRGDVNMSAASNVGISGAIYGQHVKLSGAGIKITYDPSTCPPSRARVILFK